MIDDVTALLNKYAKDKELADEKFILDVCQMTMDEMNLQEYVNEIYYTNAKNAKDTSYNIITSELIFNLYKAHDKLVIKRLNDNYFWYYNLTILSAIYHEMEHVNIEKIIDSNIEIDSLRLLLALNDPVEFLIKNKYSNNLKFKTKIFELYQKLNNKTSPNERIANIVSFKKTKEIINKLPLNNPAILTYSKLINYLEEYTILYGYKLINSQTNSPTINYLNKIPFTDNKTILKNNKEEFSINNLPFDKRLLYGLFLTKEEYQKIKKKV